VQRPAQRGPTDGFEAIRQLAVVGRGGVGAGRPDDDLSGLPGGLQPHLTCGVGRRHGGDGRDRVRHAGQQVVGGLEPGQLLLEVGHDLLALRSPDLAHGLELVLGLVEEPFEGEAPATRVGLELRELLGGGRSLGRRPRRVLESACCVMHRRTWHPWALPTGHSAGEASDSAFGISERSRTRPVHRPCWREAEPVQVTAPGAAPGNPRRTSR
jgi:hypothetical protein